MVDFKRKKNIYRGSNTCSFKVCKLTYDLFCFFCIYGLRTSLTHSRLRMPQGSPGKGRGMPPGSLSSGFDIFSRDP